jgi:hypothetical protein
MQNDRSTISITALVAQHSQGPPCRDLFGKDRRFGFRFPPSGIGFNRSSPCNACAKQCPTIALGISLDCNAQLVLFGHNVVTVGRP